MFCAADSDEETVFGDDDDGEDLDLYSRLEQQREELESELGFDKFFEVYNTVKVVPDFLCIDTNVWE